MKYTNTYRLYSSLPEPRSSRNIAAISLPALIHNYRLLLGEERSHNPALRPICVVKADAYGHGADRVAGALAGAGCDFFAVSCIDEAESLRRALGPSPDILILGCTDPREAPAIASLNLIQTVFSREYIPLLAGAARGAGVRVRVHLKLDTGMNRLGVPAQSDSQIAASADTAAALAASDVLRLEGLFTHFARADEDISAEPAGAYPSSAGEDFVDCASLGGKDFTALQFSRFAALCRRLEERGISLPCRHACNSAAALRHPEYRLDAVRLGIMLYGLSPSCSLTLPGLLPVMSLRSVVTHLHTLPPGGSVGYGGCFTSNIERSIATLPIGYADGFLRGYSGGSIKIYHGGLPYTVPIVGRICMDQLTVDVTGTPVSPGDEALLFGDTPGDIEALARRAGTIGYESLCIISSRVPRYYI